jgi:CO/xanthine dehydrogenase Mo-binding subunit
MSARHVGAGKLPLRLELRPDGRIQVFTGLPEQGSGGWQVLRRSLAVSAGLDERRIDVVHLATDEIGFDPGVGGSRVTHIASRAAERLGADLREWLFERLPQAGPTWPNDVELRDDSVVDPTSGEVLSSFDTVVARLLRPEEVVKLSTTFEAEPHGPDEGGDYDFVACAVEVAVDADTGRITVVDAVVAVDVGTVINPVAHRGQLEGGFVFGLSEALMEELAATDGIVSPLSLADLKVPSVGDIPPLRIVHVPTFVGPGAFGAKMAGELTNAVVAPAISNAIADAMGIRVTELPLSAERVHRALRER